MDCSCTVQEILSMFAGYFGNISDTFCSSAVNRRTMLRGVVCQTSCIIITDSLLMCKTFFFRKDFFVDALGNKEIIHGSLSHY